MAQNPFDQENPRLVAMRAALALQAMKGLDLESFLAGLSVALSDPTVGNCIVAALLEDAAARERMQAANARLVERLSNILEKPTRYTR